MEEPLNEMREQVDQLDRELLRVVAQRMALVRQIGNSKGDRPVIDPQREQNLTEQWEQNAEHEGVAAVLATRLLREVLSHSRRLQEFDRDAPPSYRQWARRIGYQGAPGAYSELAIRNRVGDGIETRGYRTFAALVEGLERAEIDSAMLPIENTIIGSIAETTALLIERPITILDEELWRVRHCLAALPGATLQSIRRVRSHSVALHQCRSHLAELGLEPEVFYDTAGAAASLRENGDPSTAALCSAGAAEQHGLTILARDLEDDSHNFTRFVLVARADDPRLSHAGLRPRFAKTSLILTTANRPGALAKCLQTFAAKAINLTRIESRPRPPWEYLFLIDFEGHREEPRVVSALSEIRRECEEVQILGSYPNRTSSPVADDEPVDSEPQQIEVVRVVPDRSAPLVTRAEERTIVDVGGVAIGGERFVLIAGPCAVESREQIRDAARMVSQCGGRILRGGAFKPRTSPYSFQGLGHEGVDFLQEAGHEFLLPIVTEVLDVRHLDAVARLADMIQVGARNMQNFELLKELGRIGKPVLLKRGMSATLDELLQAAEYVLLGGNSQLVLCERGIRTFERSTRNTLDVAAVPILKQRTHLPVIVDPSHAAGRRDLVVPLALAAAAAGADGLIVEAHPRPDEALSDKEQALGPEDLLGLVARLRPILHAQSRTL